ncbi:MAG: PLP-dependent transferase [Thermoanaerobaculia bacterium]
MRFETIAVHAGAEVDAETGAVAPPIHLSTTFEHGPAGESPHGFVYARYGNPTQDRLETALAAVEGGERALVFASGLSAGAAYWQTLPAGSHILLQENSYWDFRTMAREFLPRWGVETTLVDTGDLAAVEAALRPNTRSIWIETPSNPLIKIADIAALAGLARQAGAELVVDSTFASPALQNPLELGADVAFHSTTKYLGGHSDVLGGALVFKHGGERVEEIWRVRKVLGSTASPFSSWLVLRGLRSLACRVAHHSAAALRIAQALEGHPRVEAVYYPGLASHPGHEIARRQMKAFGGMLSLNIRGGREAALAVASKVKLFVNATSLGGVESLIEHRQSVEAPGSGAPEGLLRLSVGLEHADDLIEDLSQALGG